MKQVLGVLQSGKRVYYLCIIHQVLFRGKFLFCDTWLALDERIVLLGLVLVKEKGSFLLRICRVAPADLLIVINRNVYMSFFSCCSRSSIVDVVQPLPAPSSVSRDKLDEVFLPLEWRLPASFLPLVHPPSLYDRGDVYTLRSVTSSRSSDNHARHCERIFFLQYSDGSRLISQNCLLLLSLFSEQSIIKTTLEELAVAFQESLESGWKKNREGHISDIVDAQTIFAAFRAASDAKSDLMKAGVHAALVLPVQGKLFYAQAGSGGAFLYEQTTNRFFSLTCHSSAACSVEKNRMELEDYLQRYLKENPDLSAEEQQRISAKIRKAPAVRGLWASDYRGVVSTSPHITAVKFDRSKKRRYFLLHYSPEVAERLSEENIRDVVRRYFAENPAEASKADDVKIVAKQVMELFLEQLKDKGVNTSKSPRAMASVSLCMLVNKEGMERAASAVALPHQVVSEPFPLFEGVQREFESLLTQYNAAVKQSSGDADSLYTELLVLAETCPEFKERLPAYVPADMLSALFSSEKREGHEQRSEDHQRTVCSSDQTTEL